MWNARIQDKGKHGKFEPLWIGPYQIGNIHEDDSYFLQALNGELLELPMHGKLIKAYFS